MLAMDIILPPAKTEKEAWDRWKNRLQSELQTLPYYHKRKIEVHAPDQIDWAEIHGDSKVDAEHARREDEAIQDGF